MDFDIFDLLLSVSDLFGLQDQIAEEFRVQQESFNLIESSMVHFYLTQVLNFSYFIEWCTQHYSETQNAVMNRGRIKVLCQITAQTISKTLGVSYDVSKIQEFIEGVLPLVLNK